MQKGSANQGDLEDYHFKYKISIVGDSGVGKTTFLDAISAIGSNVENETSSELHIRVRVLNL